MTLTITERDLLRLKLRPHAKTDELIRPLYSVDPKDPRNADRLSLSDCWTDITISKIKSDISFFLNGKKGAGKSYAQIAIGTHCAMHLAEKNGGHWSDYFYIDLIAIMDPEEVYDLMTMKAPLVVKDYDDVSPGYNSRAFATKRNREQNDIIVTNRTDNNIQLWSSPDQGMTDKVLRETCNYYGEAERIVPAMKQGFNVIKVFQVEKNRRTGKRYYTSLWHNGCKLVKGCIDGNHPYVKKLVEEYNPKRERNQDRLRRGEFGEGRKNEGGGEKGTMSKAKRHAYEVGCEYYRLIDQEGYTPKEALMDVRVLGETWRRWVAAGWVSRELCTR